MLNSVMTLCLTVTLGQAPVDNYSYSTSSPQAIGQVMNSNVAEYAPGEGPGGMLSAGLTGSIQEELYPYDSPEPWIHGYWQEIPAYGGFAAFRPYNYKHVLSQSQAAGGWGMSAQMPYSQQFWNRYQQRAEMRTVSRPAPIYQSNRHQLVNLQSPFSQNRIQQISGRSYRQPVRIPSRVRSSSRQQPTNSAFKQRLSQANKKFQKTSQKKNKSFWSNPFSQ